MIRDEQFDAALSRFNLGKFISASPITGGNFGQVAYLTSTEGEWVFRGNPLIPGQFEVEEYFSNRLHFESAVPAAWPYLLDRGEDLFGWPFAIMPRIVGLDIDTEAASGRISLADRVELAARMGTMLALSQQVEHDEPARFDAMSNQLVAAGSSLSREIDRSIDDSIERIGQGNSPITADDLAWLTACRDRLAGVLATPFRTRLTISDFKDQNMLFRRTEDRWEIVGVFDLMGTSFSNGERSLTRQLGRCLEHDDSVPLSYVQHYVDIIEPAPGFAERLMLFMLADCLGMWEWAWREKKVWWNTSLSLRDRVEPILVKTEEIARRAHHL